MIVDIPQTSTAEVNRRLIELRRRGGAVALTRVLNLVILTDGERCEEAIDTANQASREHPCRVIVVVRGERRGNVRMDAQIRVGGDAGASDVVVLTLYGELADHARSIVVPLLLPDAPVVAWWPGEPPADPAADPIGALSQRRITDSATVGPRRRQLQKLASAYHPGDSDFAWSRLTLWRRLLAAVLDQPPFEPVTAVQVTGAFDSPSSDLLAAWLLLRLKCPVQRLRTPDGSGIISVRFDRKSGPVELARPQGDVATLTKPGVPERRISLPHRSSADCLAEELRRLDCDETYQEVLTKGLMKLSPARSAPPAS